MLQKYQRMEEEFANRPHTTSKDLDELRIQYVKSFPENVQPLAKRLDENVTMLEVGMFGSFIWTKFRYPLLIGIVVILLLVICWEVVTLI